MKTLLGLLLLVLPPALWGYGLDPDSGVFFNDTKYKLVAPSDTKTYHGVKMALLVHPEDLPERDHHSNSNMARISVLSIESGGGANAYKIDEFIEQVFIILEGSVDFQVDGVKLEAQAHDVVYVPPGARRSFTAKGDKPAKVYQAEWAQKGPLPTKPLKAFITGGRFRTPAHTGGVGYLTLTPNQRQRGLGVSILGVGGHINSSNALLLYPKDLEGKRPFTGNTALARMGFSLYHKGGGTPWHFHPDREQCFVILGGTGVYEIGPNTVEIKAGDIIFAPRLVGHGYMVTGDEPLKFCEVEWGRE